MIEFSTVAGASWSESDPWPRASKPTASTAASTSGTPRTARLEADRVDRGVDLGDAEDLLDLVLRIALGDVDRLAAEALGLRQPLRDQVADEHD
jgi:hypothetical protein